MLRNPPWVVRNCDFPQLISSYPPTPAFSANSGTAAASTSSIRSARITSSCSRTFSGRSCRSLPFSPGRMTRHAGAGGGQDFFFDSPHGQHQAREADLAGHRRVTAGGVSAVEARQGRSHGDAGRRAVLANGAGRHMNVYARLANQIAVDAQFGRLGPDVALTVLADSCITSPSWPVSISPRPSGNSTASI